MPYFYVKVALPEEKKIVYEKITLSPTKIDTVQV